MNLYRLKHTIGMYLTLSPMKRAIYLRKHHIFHHIGENCMVMFRKIPLYPQLISLANNVWIASNVSFVTHDVIHYMMNYKYKEYKLEEKIGCIQIEDNVFIGTNTTILPNVKIGPNAVIAAGAVVNKSIGEGVYAGVPAKYICSIDEFVGKREKEKGLKSKDDRDGKLTSETIEKCWEKFGEVSSAGKKEENG